MIDNELLIVGTGLPEEQLLAECFLKVNEIKRDSTHYWELPRNNYNNHFAEQLASQRLAPTHILITGSYITVEMLGTLNEMENTPQIMLVSWDIERDNLKYANVLKSDNCSITSVSRVIENLPDWVHTQVHAANEDIRAQKLHRGVIDYAQCNSIRLGKVYRLMLNSNDETIIPKLRERGEIIYNTHELAAKETVAKHGLVFVTRISQTKVCLVVGGITPVRHYVDAALNANEHIQMGVLVRYSAEDQLTKLSTTYLSFITHDKDKAILRAVEQTPFNGGGQQTLKGCNFPGHWPVEILVELIRRCF